MRPGVWKLGGPNTEQNTTPEPNTEHNKTGPEHRTPNTPEHKVEHVQKPNAEHNNEHEQPFSEHRTVFIANPDSEACSYLKMHENLHE